LDARQNLKKALEALDDTSNVCSPAVTDIYGKAGIDDECRFLTEEAKAAQETARHQALINRSSAAPSPAREVDEQKPKGGDSLPHVHGPQSMRQQWLNRLHRLQMEKAQMEENAAASADATSSTLVSASLSVRKLGNDQPEAKQIKKSFKQAGGLVRTLAKFNVDMTTEVLTIRNFNSLAVTLRNNGIDTSKFGKNNACTLEELYEEIQRGDSRLIQRGGELFRCLRVLFLEIRRGAKSLVKTHEITATGSVRLLCGLPTAFILTGDDFKTTAQRCLESLSLSPATAQSLASGIHKAQAKPLKPRYDSSSFHAGVRTVIEGMHLITSWPQDIVLP
jgi:hypothetical protein